VTSGFDIGWIGTISVFYVPRRSLEGSAEVQAQEEVHHSKSAPAIVVVAVPSEEELPYGGDMQAAMRAMDRAAIKAIMAAKQQRKANIQALKEQQKAEMESIDNSSQRDDGSRADAIPFALVAHRIGAHSHVLKLWCLSQRAINDKKSPGELGSVMREEMIEFYGHNAAITCVATFDSRLLLGTNIFRLFVEKNEEARAEARRARIHAARKNSQGEVPPSPKSISGSVSHARRQSFSTGEVRSMMKGGGLAAHGLKSAQCSPALEEMGMVVWEGDEPNGKGRKFRDEGFLDSVGRATQRDGGAADMANGADLYSRGRGRRLVHRFRHWAISGSEDRTLRVWYIPVHWEDKVQPYTPPPYTPPFLSIGRTRYTPTLLPHTLLHSCPLGGQGTTCSCPLERNTRYLHFAAIVAL
jgi:hypothetical protein